MLEQALSVRWPWGNWRLLLLRTDCPNCEAILAPFRNEAAGAGETAAAPLVLLDLAAAANEELSRDGEVAAVHARMATPLHWYVDQPSLLAMEQGVVIAYQALSPEISELRDSGGGKKETGS